MAMAIWLRRLPDTVEGWMILVAVFVAFIVAAFFLARHRRKGLERVAQEMGFSFDADGEKLEPGGFHNLPLLARNTGLSNALRGSVRTGEAVVLDVETGSGKSSQTHTVACLKLAGKQFPGFEMRPENMFHKIGSVFGYKDIDFQENEEFSKSYLLRGEDETAIRMLFHPGRLAFFEQHKGWCVEGAGEWLAIYKSGKTVGPSNVRGFIEEATGVASAFL
jgi:hypothetical protein